MKTATAAILLLAVLAAAALGDEPARPGKWSDELLETMATLPIQEGGRVKPISTFARFRLLAMNGRTSVVDPAGEKLKGTEWLLDCLFHPEQASTCDVFLVQNDEVIEALRLSTEGKKKRDRYSLVDLVGARDRLMQLGQRIEQVREEDRDTVERQVFALAINFIEQTRLIAALPKGEPPFRQRSDTLTIFPPPGDEKVWLSPFEVLERGAAEPARYAAQLALVEKLRSAWEDRNDPGKLEAALTELHAGIVGLARARGEYDGIELEVSFYRAAWFHWSLGFFVMAFLALAATWMLPRSRIAYLAVHVLALAAIVPLAAGIIQRCIIRGRPPVTTLYETILFITAVAALTGVVVEYLNRRRVALGAGVVLGVLGMFLANKYEVSKGVDTMPTLIAVLDTNFWLATHVTTISMGYAAGLLAAGVAHIYIFGKLLGFRSGDEQFYRDVTRVTYGVVCFGPLFSVLGTLLGGIWANDSWGRFWGWDPKENGALMICLWMLAMVHARVGGYIRDLGIAMASVFGGIVVAFSWWGVNLLGVGLHSYGFTSGILRSLLVFVGIETLVVLLGLVVALTRRPESAEAPEPPRV